MAEIVIEHDQEYNLALCVPTKEGYTFLGWYDANDNRIFKIEKGTINDITLYGKWERKITEGLEYELSSDKTYYTIVGIGTATDTDIVIPSTYNSLPVKSIAYKAFYNCDNLTSVVIGDNITTIENNAFSLSSNLTSVVIGENVENIGFQAFELCSNLENVVMGNNVKSIGTQAFYNCPKLTSINIPSSVSNIGEQVFTYCRKLTSINVDINNGFYKSIDGNLYTKDEKTLIHYSTGKTDSTFVVPNGVTNVKQYAFYFSDYLEKIEIPNSVVNIEQYAFLNCDKLEYIDNVNGRYLSPLLCKRD